LSCLMVEVLELCHLPHPSTPFQEIKPSFGTTTCESFILVIFPKTSLTSTMANNNPKKNLKTQWLDFIKIL
jgi:hypothetical protein